MTWSAERVETQAQSESVSNGKPRTEVSIAGRKYG